MRSSQKKMGREEDISLLSGAEAEEEDFADSAEVALGSAAEVDLSVEIPRRRASAVSEDGPVPADKSEKMERLEMESASEEELRLLGRGEGAALRKRRFLVFDTETKLSKAMFKASLTSWVDEMESLSAKSTGLDVWENKELSGPLHKMIASLVYQNKSKENLACIQIPFAKMVHYKKLDDSWPSSPQLSGFEGKSAFEKNDSFGEGEDEMAAEIHSSSFEADAELDRHSIEVDQQSVNESGMGSEMADKTEVKLGRRAAKVVARLQKVNDGELSFDELTRGCSRKVVAGIFFELLAMQSNSIVQCEQKTPNTVIVRLREGSGEKV